MSFKCIFSHKDWSLQGKDRVLVQLPMYTCFENLREIVTKGKDRVFSCKDRSLREYSLKILLPAFYLKFLLHLHKKIESWSPRIKSLLTKTWSLSLSCWFSQGHFFLCFFTWFPMTFPLIVKSIIALNADHLTDFLLELTGFYWLQTWTKLGVYRK